MCGRSFFVSVHSEPRGLSTIHSGLSTNDYVLPEAAAAEDQEDDEEDQRNERGDTHPAAAIAAGRQPGDSHGVDPSVRRPGNRVIGFRER